MSFFHWRYKSTTYILTGQIYFIKVIHTLSTLVLESRNLVPW